MPGYSQGCHSWSLVKEIPWVAGDTVLKTKALCNISIRPAISGMAIEHAQRRTIEHAQLRRRTIEPLILMVE